MRRYWTFYWPLALTGLFTLLAVQFKNGVLASYPDAERELATFALASSTFAFLHACLIFIPQMTNVLARSVRSREQCLRFIIGAAIVLSCPMFLLGFTDAGNRAIAAIYNIEGQMLADVAAYLRLLTPLLLIHAVRNYFAGLLVQAERTRVVVALEVLGALCVLTVLVSGLLMGWSPVRTLAGSMLAGGSLNMVLSFALVRRSRDSLMSHEGHEIQYGDILRFFAPAAATSVMFAFSRPIMYMFINRGPDAVVTVAAMRVAFDFAMLFHNPANQFRHLLVTYGKDDVRGVRRFMRRVMAVLFVTMVLATFTPLSRLILNGLMGIEGETLTKAVWTLRVLCLTPVVITLRNVYHGQLMLGRRTHGMAAGAVFRIGIIALGSWILFMLGLMNHIAGAALLIAGFSLEAVVSRVFVRHTRR